MLYAFHVMDVTLWELNMSEQSCAKGKKKTKLCSLVLQSSSARTLV